MGHDVHVMRADALGSQSHYYFACPGCGWCGPLRSVYEAAEIDGEAHENAKVRQAERAD